MLHIQNVSVHFGNEEIFHRLNLHINKGEIVCITGKSGSGKTTLLRAIMGFVPIQEGTITVDGVELTAKTADHIRRKIAWMPQELALPSEWVNEMIRLPFELKANRGIPFSEKKLLSNFTKLGLEQELLLKRVNEISGGQRQRIMLAVSALLDKKLIIVDEPTSALDNTSSINVINFMRTLLNEGRAILAVSHDSYFSEGCTRTFTL